MLAEEFLQRLACLCRHLLQRHATVADDDALLRVALHINHGVNVDLVLLLLEHVNAHLHRVRNLLVIVEQNLLAYNLRHEEASWLVGELILVKVRGRRWQQLLNALHQDVGAKLVLCRYGQNLGVGKQRVPFLHDVAELFLLAHVDLVDEQQHGDGHLLHLVEEVHVLLGVLHHVGDVEQHVGIFQRRRASTLEAYSWA